MNRPRIRFCDLAPVHLVQVQGHQKPQQKILGPLGSWSRRTSISALAPYRQLQLLRLMKKKNGVPTRKSCLQLQPGSNKAPASRRSRPKRQRWKWWATVVLPQGPCPIRAGKARKALLCDLLGQLSPQGLGRNVAVAFALPVGDEVRRKTCGKRFRGPFRPSHLMVWRRRRHRLLVRPFQRMGSVQVGGLRGLRNLRSLRQRRSKGPTKRLVLAALPQ